LYKGEYDKNALIYGGILAGILCITSVLIIINQLGDEYLFIIISMQISIGAVILYRLGSAIVARQIVWVVFGTFLFFATYFIYIKFFSKWQNFSGYYYIGSVFLFTLTLVFGDSTYGAKNWIYIGGQGFQPGEIIKILFILFLSSYSIWLKEEKISLSEVFSFLKKYKKYFDIEKYKFMNIKLPRFLIILVMVYILIGFLILQRDWGTALEFFIIYSLITYVFENKKTIMFVVVPNLLLAVFGSMAGYHVLSHIKTRFDVWLDPWSYSQTGGYQIIQSLFAISEGDFFGRGLGNGLLEKIPFVSTDFIFAGICEEMGMFAGAAVIILFFILVYRGLKVSLSIKNLFHKKVAFGITALFGIQTFIIIGGVIKMIPLTGITLPFISYGGTSLTTSFIALGILQSVSNKSYDKEGISE
jgi:cell division protein FtsW (lipid II flippase)